jgi:hypothetical protein
MDDGANKAPTSGRDLKNLERQAGIIISESMVEAAKRTMMAYNDSLDNRKAILNDFSRWSDLVLRKDRKVERDALANCINGAERTRVKTIMDGARGRRLTSRNQEWLIDMALAKDQVAYREARQELINATFEANPALRDGSGAYTQQENDRKMRFGLRVLFTDLAENELTYCAIPAEFLAIDHTPQR